jgi:hypothetical protein
MLISLVEALVKIVVRVAVRCPGMTVRADLPNQLVDC